MIKTILILALLGVYFSSSQVDAKSLEQSEGKIFGLYCVSCSWQEGDEDDRCVTGPFTILDYKKCESGGGFFNGCMCRKRTSIVNGVRILVRAPYAYQFGQDEGCFNYPDSMPINGSPLETHRQSCYCRDSNGCNEGGFEEIPTIPK